MSGKVRDYTRLAKDILEAVGGEENMIGLLAALPDFDWC